MLLKFSAFRLVILVLCLVMSGCIPQAQSGKSQPEKVTENTQKWTILLSINGGFAGWMKTLSINSAGTLIINDLKRNKSSRNKLNNNELAALSDLVAEIKGLKSEPKSSNFTQSCADCFNYELSIRSHNQEQLAVLNDLNLSQSGFNQIVVYLRKMATKYEN